MCVCVRETEIFCYDPYLSMQQLGLHPFFSVKDDSDAIEKDKKVINLRKAFFLLKKKFAQTLN